MLKVRLEAARRVHLKQLVVVLVLGLPGSGFHTLLGTTRAPSFCSLFTWQQDNREA